MPVSPSTRSTRTKLVIALIIGAIIATVVSLIVSAAASDAAGESTYVPLTPHRILDTRPAPFQTGGYDTPWGADTTRPVTVAGVDLVPVDAKAVVLNITTVSPTAPNSFLTVFPTGESQPTAASLNFVAGEIKNDIVIATIGAGGQIDIYNQLGTVDLVIDVNGYYTDSVEARVAQIETLLAGLSRETVDGEDTLRLTGANLQLVNGTGATYSANAVGNLIVGYNATTADIRDGSHNLIVGDGHTYTANGTVLFGADNETTANKTAVTGGNSNSASGDVASISGGTGNIASGANSSVTGGSANSASGESSSVTGGSANEATQSGASVTGGTHNTASGEWSSVTGGENNTASDGDCTKAIVASSVSGGRQNVASGCHSSILGGGDDTAPEGNTATGAYSVVVGGHTNTATGRHAAVGGGKSGIASGPEAVVAGGNRNEASGSASTVTGGQQNTASGTYSNVSGGATRSVSGVNDWRAGSLFETS